MRKSDGSDRQAGEPDRDAGPDGEAQLLRRRVAQRTHGAPRRVDPDAEPAREDPRRVRVVGVLVGEEQVGQVANVEPSAFAPARGLAQRKASVDEDARSGSVHPEGIASAAAGEDAQAH